MGKEANTYVQIWANREKAIEEVVLPVDRLVCDIETERETISSGTK